MSDQNDKQDPNLQTNEIGIEDDGMDITLEQMSQLMRAQLVLKRAFDNKQEEEFLLALDEHHRERLKEMSAESLPLFTSNPSLLASHSDLIIETYPELSAKVDRDIASVSGRMLMESAGYSDKEINEVENTSPEFLDSLAVTRFHEETFGFKGESLNHRLRSTKDSVLEQLGKPGARRALQVAGVAIGCATGGIFISAGMKASGMLASKLANTSGFQALMAGLTNSAEKVASKLTGKPVEEIRESAANRKKSLSALFKKPYVAIPATLAIGAMAFVAFGSTEFGQQAIDSISDKAGSAYGYVADAASPLVEMASPLVDKAGSTVSAALSSVGEGISSTFSGVTESAIADAFAEAEATNPGWSDRYIDGLPPIEDTPSAFAEAARGDSAWSRARESVLDVIGQGSEGVDVVAETGIDAEPVVYTISSGDNLWNIAKAQLEASGLEISNRSIFEATQAIYDANADVIGGNPDLIMPGVDLNIPDLGSAPPVPDAPSLPQGSVSPGLPWGELDFESLVDIMETPGLDDNNGVINLDKEAVSAVKRDRGGPDPSGF